MPAARAALVVLAAWVSLRSAVVLSPALPRVAVLVSLPLSRVAMVG
jgi:hypothetical protein